MAGTERFNCEYSFYFYSVPLCSDTDVEVSDCVEVMVEQFSRCPITVAPDVAAVVQEAFEFPEAASTPLCDEAAEALDDLDFLM